MDKVIVANQQTARAATPDADPGRAGAAQIPGYALAALIFTAALAPATIGAQPVVKVLSPAQDATKNTILVGRSLFNTMCVTQGAEGAEAMWMQMGKTAEWMKQAVIPGAPFA